VTDPQRRTYAPALALEAELARLRAELADTKREAEECRKHALKALQDAATARNHSERARAELAAEKELRVRYQATVYTVCTWIDSRLRSGITGAHQDEVLARLNAVWEKFHEANTLAASLQAELAAANERAENAERELAAARRDSERIWNEVSAVCDSMEDPIMAKIGKAVGTSYCTVEMWARLLRATLDALPPAPPKEASNS
jgi:predicted  nucleic acid-binding Zn-ribbon protein